MCLLAQAMLQAQLQGERSEEKKCLAAASRSFFFFGTLFRGLVAEEMNEVIKDSCQGRSDVLQEIEKGSKILQARCSRFIDWVSGRSIVMFLETQEVRKLENVN